MGGINWSNSGTAEFGGPFPARAASRISSSIAVGSVLRAEVLGKRVLTTFDTGANGTDLNGNFADLFPDVVAGGKKGSADIRAASAARGPFASVELPELIFTIGSRPGSFAPGRHHDAAKQRYAGGECCIANGWILIC